MTPWVIGITRDTHAYYLVFHYDMHSILDRFIRTTKDVEYMQYYDFYKIKQIGVGGYGTVYTAKYNGKYINIPKTVVLKRFKAFDELFINEVSTFLI